LVANQSFAGHSTETRAVTVPMQYLRDKSSKNLEISKNGSGRLYYRIGLDYVPRNLNLASIDQGFSVSRGYEAVDAQDDLSQDQNGIWHIRAGSTIRAKVHFSCPGMRYHVAMSDPLPGGAEALNHSLVGTRSLVAGDIDQTWRSHWYDHDNLRSSEAEAFCSALSAGDYAYTYLIHATTPGTFTVPPTKVQEMYMSETFGRGKTETVVIE